MLGRDYVLMVVLSCAIATFGLALDSGAVIIGAMLISPLMTPILGVAMGLVHGEPRTVLRALGTLALGMLLAVALGAALGQLVIPFGIDLVEQLPAEILSRTRPTLFDLAVALADEVVEVKTGLLGLGKHLFVPLGVIQEVISDSVILSIEGFPAEVNNFKRKPDYLATLH